MGQFDIAYVPFDKTNESNAYAFRMREILSAFGSVAPFVGVKAMLADMLRCRFKRVDAIVLNWVDSEILHPHSHRLAAGRILKLFVRTAMMRLAARTVIFVRHNHYPHATVAGEESRARRWVDRLERLCDFSVTHSKAAAHEGRSYVPHPLYRHGPVRPEAIDGWGLPGAYFVMFGVISPYKRIADVIERLPDDKTLVIAGAVGDAAYVRRLEAMQRHNVIVRAGFVDDVQAQALVARSTALIIAHADADVIVSGSFFFAISVGTPVIALQTPFLSGIQAEFGPDMVTVGADLAELGHAIGAFGGGRGTAQMADRIEQAFGDEAVRRAWQPFIAA